MTIFGIWGQLSSFLMIWTQFCNFWQKCSKFKNFDEKNQLLAQKLENQKSHQTQCVKTYCLWFGWNFNPLFSWRKKTVCVKEAGKLANQYFTLCRFEFFVIKSTSLKAPQQWFKVGQVFFLKTRKTNIQQYVECEKPIATDWKELMWQVWSRSYASLSLNSCMYSLFGFITINFAKESCSLPLKPLHRKYHYCLHVSWKFDWSKWCENHSFLSRGFICIGVGHLWLSAIGITCQFAPQGCWWW